MSEWLHISEHEWSSASGSVICLPALGTQHVELTGEWKPIKLKTPATQVVRLCATEDCIVVCSVSETVDTGDEIWLMGGIPETFMVPRGRAVYLAVKAVPDEEA